MSDKILIADLVSAVADIAGVSKNRCDDFVKSFFEAIANALSVDGVAKVKGLGTFKLVAVEERKSVNVQTGAEMIIPAHSKVTFLPDKALKDEINKPYAHLKTYVLNPDAPLDPPEQDDDDVVIEENAVVEQQNVDAPATDSDSVADDVVASAANEVVTADTEAANTNEKPEEHSDWFDNWEVEYDAPKQNQEESSTEEKKQTTSLSSLLSSSQPVDEPADNTTTSAQDLADVETVDDVQEPSEVVAQSQEVVSGDHIDAVDDSKVVIPVETSVEADSNTNESEDAVTVSESEVVEEPQTEDNALSDEVMVGDSVPEASAEGLVADETIVKDEQEVNEDSNSDKDVASSYNSRYQDDEDFDDDEPEKVQRGKVLGVAIIAFLLLFGVAIFGIHKLDPDFFNNLKASSDNPPVMPIDTTSLAQELSVYTEDAPQDSVVEQQVVEEVTEELESNPVNVVATSIDPLWDGEFVAYMKRHHPECNLVTNGLKNEVAIKPGLYLTMVALDNYGDKSYWIYLYLYNRDRIKNPNNVPIGTKIRVPKLDASLVNGDSEDKVAVAKEVRQVFAK